jgi:hypothetical protein
MPRPARLGLLAPLLLAVLVSACSPTTSTAIASGGLERQPDGWRGLPIGTERPLPGVTVF